MRRWPWIAVVCCWASHADAGEVRYELSDFWNDCAPCGNFDGCCDLNCDSLCCDDCCPPCWELSVGLLVMARENKDVPVALDPDFVGPILTADDLDGEYDLGFELLARHRRWELRYLQITHETSDTIAGSGNYLNIAFAGPATFVYDTALYSGEASYLLTPIGDPFRVTAGLRYLRLNDTIDFNSPVPPPTDVLTTTNDLLGAQLGLEYRLRLDESSRFSLTTFGKAGVHYVNASLDNTAFGVTTSDSFDGVAFVGEVGVKGSYHITRWLSLDAGYQLLFLEGVATAAEQTSSVDAIAPSAAINSGGVLYHGFLFGATATW